MSFTLKVTEHYLDDVNRLPADVRHKQLLRTQKLLQQDPNHPGLRSHQFRGLSKDRVFRSYVNDRYRIAWWYKTDRTIVLWHVGSHKDIDELENLKRIPNIGIENEIPYVPVPANGEKPPGRDTKAGTPSDCYSKEERPFGSYNPTQLRLLGVPSALVANVRKANNFEEILGIKLPRHAREILLSIYTSPDWSPENLIDIRQVLYRASVDQLEDYCKGKIRALMLDLSDEQEQILRSRAGGAMLIKGVAGSGKTTVGVYRALILSKESRMFEKMPVLFLTYNETLAKVVNRMFHELTNSDEHKTLKDRVVVQTMRDWANNYLISRGMDRIFDMGKADSILAGVISRQIKDESKYKFLKLDHFFPTEISQVIKGRGVKNWGTYRKIRRHGRGQPLLESMRRIVWDVYQEYQDLLLEKNVMDEADLYLQVYDLLDNDSEFDPYSEVVVDEAQDLTPMALSVAAKIAGGGTSERLALLVDPTQSIYYKGISWKDGEIIIHSSRVKTLHKNFRNTRQILEAAWALAEADPEHTLQEAIKPETTDRPGIKPIVIEVPSESEQDLKRMKELVVNLAGSNRYRLADIAVLSRVRDKAIATTDYLRRSGIPVCHFREDSFDIFENNVKVITFNSAKGLEFPVVILMNVEEGVLPRNISFHINSEDFQAALRIERQLLYVGMTRAADELYLIFTEGRRSRFLDDIPRELLKLED